MAVLRYLGDSDRTAREHVRDATQRVGTDAEEDNPRELWLYKYLSFAADAGVPVQPKDAVAAARDDQGHQPRDVVPAFRLAQGSRSC